MMALALLLWSLRYSWRDSVAERLRWLVSDLRGDNTTDWTGPTDEWLPAPRKNLGSVR